MLALAAASLHALGIGKGAARIAVGTVGYFSALIAAAGASPRLARALTDAIDRKDLPGLTLLCTREVPPGKPREALLMLAQPPRPQTEASALLSRAEELAPDEAAAAALRRLSSALQVAQARNLGAELEVDLGEVRGLGYYTGLVFNLYAAGAPRVVGGGGRYDTLLGRFGDPRPAVGSRGDRRARGGVVGDRPGVGARLVRSVGGVVGARSRTGPADRLGAAQPRVSARRVAEPVDGGDRRSR